MTEVKKRVNEVVIPWEVIGAWALKNQTDEYGLAGVLREYGFDLDYPFEAYEVAEGLYGLQVIGEEVGDHFKQKKSS